MVTTAHLLLRLHSYSEHSMAPAALTIHRCRSNTTIVPTFSKHLHTHIHTLYAHGKLVTIILTVTLSVQYYICVTLH